MAFEMVAVGKGVILVSLPEEKLRHSDGEPLLSHSPQSLFREAYPIIQRAEEIPEAFEQVRFPSALMQTRQRGIRSRLFLPVDGQASHRALKIIDSWFKEL